MPSNHRHPPSPRAVHTLTPRRKPGARGGARKGSSSAVAAHRLQQSPTPTQQEGAAAGSPPAGLMGGKPIEVGAGDATSSDDGSSSSSSDDESTAAAAANANHTNGRAPPKLDRAALLASLPPDVDTAGLSDYEVLRLYNIKRNEAKLASLGLAGITSPSHPRNAAAATAQAKEKDKRTEASRKATETRRRNRERGREARREIERWERSAKKPEERQGSSDDEDSDNEEAKPGSSKSKSRSQPSRAAKSKEITYAPPAYAAPPRRLQQWTARLAELRAFHARHGHYRLSRKANDDDDEQYKPLERWFRRQRTQYTKWTRGEKSALDEERVALLETLEGEWWRTARPRGRYSPSGQKKFVFGGGRFGASSSPAAARRLWRADGESESDEDEEAAARMRREVDEETTETEEEVDIGAEDSYSEGSLVEEEEEKYDRRLEKDRGSGKRRRLEYSSDDSRNDHPRRRTRSASRTKRAQSALVDDAAPTSNWKGGRSSGRRSKSLRTRKGEVRRQRYSRRGRSSTSRRSLSSDYSESEEESIVSQSKRRKTAGRYSGRYRSPQRHYYSDTESEEPSVRKTRSASPRRTHRSVERRSRRSPQKENSRQIQHRRRHSIQKPMEEIIIAPFTQLSARAERHRRREMQQRERDELMAEYGRLYGRRCAILERRARLEYELRAIQSFIASVKGAGANHLLNHVGIGGLLPAASMGAAAPAAQLLCSAGSS